MSAAVRILFFGVLDSALRRIPNWRDLLVSGTRTSRRFGSGGRAELDEGVDADGFAVDDNLRHGARVVSNHLHFEQASVIQVDAHLVERNLPFFQQGFGLVTKWTGASAINFYARHVMVLSKIVR